MYDFTPEPGKHRAETTPLMTESQHEPRHARWRSVPASMVPELVAGAVAKMPRGIRPRAVDAAAVPL